MRNSIPMRLLALALFTAASVAGCSGARKTAPPASAIPLTPAISDSQVGAVLANSCFGCHSNSARPPWYARIAPSYWADRSGARKALNFSEWPGYDGATKRAEIQAISAAVRTGSMPPGDYTFFDRSARLTEDQKQSVVQWAEKQSAPGAQ